MSDLIAWAEAHPSEWDALERGTGAESPDARVRGGTPGEKDGEMNDTELAGVLAQYEPLVKKTAKVIWLEAGSPDGIRPEDLYNYGRSGLVEAVNALEKSGRDLKLLASVRVKDRIRDGLRNLQVGAVTTENVKRPDGAVGRFAYAVSADFGEVEHRLQDERPKPSRELRRLQTRIRQQFGAAGFQDVSAAHLDYAEAVSRIPDRLDRFAVHVFTMVQLVSPDEAPERIWRVLADFWTRRKTALAVTQHVMSNHASADQVAAHLERAAAWINAYCEGQPMPEYPELRSFAA